MFVYDISEIRRKTMPEFDEELTNNPTPQKPVEKSYTFHHGKDLKEGEEPLSNVIGHENQKKELLAVIDWFKRSKELKAKGISIPKGLCLFGPPGCGKSLLIKEIIRCVDAPVFVFEGEQDNVVKGIVEMFTKAREIGHAIVVIDELDLLLNRDRHIVRALQENLDGVESGTGDDILVLTATNDIDEIPDALLRNGRLDKIIRIPNPKGFEAVALFKKLMKEFNVTLPDDLDEEELETSLHRISCSSVKAIVNDIVLRNGFENITTEMIYASIFNITNRVKDSTEEDNAEVSAHEAAHCVMACAFPQFFTVNRLDISGASGEFRAKEVEEYFWPYDKVVADIKIAMAGLIGQKLLYGRGSRGVESDLQRARIDAYNIFNMNGYSSCWEVLPPVQNGCRTETQVKRRRMEKKIEKLLRKCEKETYRYLKANLDKVKQLARLLYEKKHLKQTEILSVLG